jgi:pimeloyl-ACP methyl ester carboxylesterase
MPQPHRVPPRAVAVAAAAGAVIAASVAWRHRTDRTGWSPSAGVVVDGPLPAHVVGQGPVRAVLLHGLFNSGRYWGRAYDGVAGGGRSVAPDLLGFGRGPRPSDGYTADAHADAVADTLRQLGVDGPMVVAGHSVGALVALRLAVQHPELVGGVVAFAPPLHRDPGSARTHIARIDPLAGLLVANTDLAARACALMCRHRSAAATAVRLFRPDLPAPLADDRVEHSWASYSQTLSNMVLAAEASSWLPEISVSVRILAGSDDDGLDHQYLTELADRYAHVTLDQVPGGHDLPLAAPELCLAVIRDALADVDALRGPGRR